MMDVPVQDDLDRRIVMALQINGRPSWKQIAQALGASESAVVNSCWTIAGSQ